MTPQHFVLALKAEVAKSAASEIGYYGNPLSKQPPEHLTRFSQWFGRLSEADKEDDGRIGQVCKGRGTLFASDIFGQSGISYCGTRQTRLFHIDANGNRIRLNEPDGELLTDIFNNEG